MPDTADVIEPSGSVRRLGTRGRVAVLAVVVAVVAALVDVRAAIGFSSFGVLLYYAIANASAWTLGARFVPAVGLIGCLTLAFTLPLTSVLAGAVVVLLGMVAYLTSGRHHHGV